MKFYEAISEYYTYIFPYDAMQLVFINNFTPKNASVLEVGCSVGDLTLHLAKDGHTVNALDYDSSMINNAQSSNNHENITYMPMDMRTIASCFDAHQFDTICCFGNILVHLSNAEEIEQFINDCKLLLKPKGTLLLQLMNYDYILSNNKKSLPTIENDKIKFERTYEYPLKDCRENDHRINFNTTLTVKNTNEQLHNTIKLHPMTPNQLLSLLHSLGFSNVSTFCSFDGSPFFKESNRFIVTASI